jgi:small subunit ribosomal protein S8
MDTIGDFITIIRNASRAGLDKCQASWSKMREAIAKILLSEGFIAAYHVVQHDGQARLEIVLKYVRHKNGLREPAIVGIDRHSRPGCRLYYGHNEIPRVLGGLGVGILTTSRGVMHDREAARQRVGGEMLCRVW